MSTQYPVKGFELILIMSLLLDQDWHPTQLICYYKSV